MKSLPPLSEEAKKLRPGIYQLFKGNEFQLLYIARFEENLREAVVYQALYGEKGVWIRSLDDFVQLIAVPHGSMTPRFRFLREA